MTVTCKDDGFMNTSRAEAKTVMNRQEVLQGYRDNSERTGALLGIASQDAYYDSPAPVTASSSGRFLRRSHSHIPTFAINVTRLDYCVRLGKGESIWAESSFKYEHEQARLL